MVPISLSAPPLIPLAHALHFPIFLLLFGVLSGELISLHPVEEFLLIPCAPGKIPLLHCFSTSPSTSLLV